MPQISPNVIAGSAWVGVIVGTALRTLMFVASLEPLIEESKMTSEAGVESTFVLPEPGKLAQAILAFLVQLYLFVTAMRGLKLSIKDLVSEYDQLIEIKDPGRWSKLILSILSLGSSVALYWPMIDEGQTLCHDGLAVNTTCYQPEVFGLPAFAGNEQDHDLIQALFLMLFTLFQLMDQALIWFNKPVAASMSEPLKRAGEAICFAACCCIQGGNESDALKGGDANPVYGQSFDQGEQPQA